MSKSTKDDIYAYALSKTLTKVSSPATVGLYSLCENRINTILGQMEVHLQQEATRIEKEYKGRFKPRVTPSVGGFFALIGRMLFYRPIWTEENQDHHNVRFIYVHFSAWHFAGSDLLWAGIAIRLYEAMKLNFGKLPLVLYRVVQHDEEDEVQNKKVEDGPNQWRSKMFCCCPLWFLVVFTLVVPIIILIVWYTTGLPKPDLTETVAVNGTTAQMNVVEGMAIAALGLPAVTALRFVYMMGKNLIISLDLKLKTGMDNERISKKLGFMNEVRKEMWFMSQFVQFMEVFERRRIRVVLEITNLDRCSPKKIVAVLDAINILLSDEESPYISILAVNPDVLVQKVNFADGCLAKEDRAYALLNRIVTVAFTIPPLCDDSKRNLFNSLTSNSKTPEESLSNVKRRSGSLRKTSSSDFPFVEFALQTKESNPLMDKTTATLDVRYEEVEKLVRSILTSDGTNLNKYMTEDSMSMRRVINAIRVTVIIMMALKKELPRGEHVAAWVVLANQWPCRLSWIIQCVEDAEQGAEIDRYDEANTDDSKTLWKVFNESRSELYVMSAHIEDLLEQDGDPEMFERFLLVDFKFTVKDLKTFKVAMVNLNHSIRKELAHIRGTSRLKDSGWIRELPLPITTIIKMGTEDVCKELERMEFPSKYLGIVRENNLSGSALVFGDADDLKELLHMNFGEWATFSVHFLGLPAHLRQQYRKMPAKPSHPRNHLSGFPHHAHHHYSSNPSLVNSGM